jgi:hypothetical protein
VVQKFSMLFEKKNYAVSGLIFAHVNYKTGFSNGSLLISIHDYYKKSVGDKGG